MDDLTSLEIPQIYPTPAATRRYEDAIAIVTDGKRCDEVVLHIQGSRGEAPFQIPYADPTVECTSYEVTAQCVAMGDARTKPIPSRRVQSACSSCRPTFDFTCIACDRFAITTEGHILVGDNATNI